MKVFVDSSAFIALNDNADSRHAAATRFLETLSSGDRAWTSNYVVDETATRLRYSVGHAVALRFLDSILASRTCSILYVDADVERAAVEVFRLYRDKKLSFTDCTTAAFMRERRFDAVFAFDEDFQRMGLRTLPG